MAAPDLVIRGRRVVLPGGMAPASIAVTGGVIAAVDPYETAAAGAPIVDAGEAIVLPGLVDPHVHVNEPGRTEWEGFQSAGRAAAAGGVTTIVDMPLNCRPPTVDVDALAAKVAAAEAGCLVDCGFWGGVVPGRAEALGPLLDAGALGAKAFLVPSGVPEFPPVTADDLRPAMRELASRGKPLLAHAESAARLAPVGSAPLLRYADYRATRPEEAEVDAIALLARLAGETGCRVHVVHVSSGAGAAEVARARSAGLPMTAETCPHYLTFAAEEIADGDTRFKCAPPIRGAEDREALWRALREGVLDLVASDHSPCSPALKREGEGDFGTAWGGVASLGLGLAAVWTGGRARGVGFADLARWLAAGPARLAGLENRKGAIVPGLDADLVVWDPDRSFTVGPDALHFRHRLTPYHGLRLNGVVLRTFLRGIPVYDRGAFDPAPAGRPLLRRAA